MEEKIVSIDGLPLKTKLVVTLVAGLAGAVVTKVTEFALKNYLLHRVGVEAEVDIQS